VRRVAERLPQHEHVPTEVPLLDERVGPHGFQEIVLGDDRLAVPDQNEEDLESLGRERNRFLAAQQQLLVRIDPEPAELIEFPRAGEVAGRHALAGVSRESRILARPLS
jgi:hypothetical protein